MSLRAGSGVGASIAVAVVLCVLPFTTSDFNLLRLASVGYFFIAIFSLNILTGYTGQISLGQGGLMMIGGYTTAILAGHPISDPTAQPHMGELWTIPIAALVSFGVGLLIGVPALRLRGLLLALATFALAVSLPQIVIKFPGFTGGYSGLLLPSHSNLWYYEVSWTCAAIAFVLGWLMLRGRTGRAFRALRDSEVAAASSGVSVAFYRILAFGISSAMAGVAGSVFVIVYPYVQPNSFPISLSINILVGAAIAGLGSLWGMLPGALFLEYFPILTQKASSNAQGAFQGLVLIIVMLALRRGFAGLVPATGTLIRRVRTLAASRP